MRESYFAGIDIGASNTKAVIINDNAHLLGSSVEKTGIQYMKVAAQCFEQALAQAGVEQTAVAGTVGIFVGCAYTDPNTNQKTFSQQWPASTVASDAVAYVVDDPKLLFQMQGDGSIAQTGLGNNVQAISTAGSTAIGRSKNALDASSIATTNTFPLRIIDFVDGPDSAVGDTYTDCIVTYLPLSHAYETALGV